MWKNPIDSVPVRLIAVGALIVAALSPTAMGIVLHDDNQLPAGQRPADAVIGSWGTNASCVVIGPGIVLTTTHQGGPSVVQVDGVTYQVSSAGDFVGGASGDDDIRIGQLSLNSAPADLAYWVDIYDGPSGDLMDQVVAMGGYGKGRGSSLTTRWGQKTYGYQWASEPNTTLRWGENVVEVVTSDWMSVRFDGPGQPQARPYEAAVAEYDSGGGWFINQDGKWMVAGLTVGAEHAAQGQSIFATSTSGAPDPDRLDAIRVDYYAAWIQSKLDLILPTPGDTDRDGDVDYDDMVAFAAHYGDTVDAPWSAGNFNGDGKVDQIDMHRMANNYGYGAPLAGSFQSDWARLNQSVPDGIPIPEPTSLILLASGAMMTFRRRRR